MPRFNLLVTCRRSSSHIVCTAKRIVFAIRRGTAPGVELACSRKHQIEQAIDEKSVANSK